MNNIVDIRSRLPHITGKAICLNCKFEYVAVAEIGTIQMECVQCGLMKCVFNAICLSDEIFQCNCGCHHFCITKKGAQCLLCGLTMTF